ncbi:MAG: S-layer homology domain-containing protein, partial [Clostridiales bacterium]|nr:S-layer homology domain-containing protein [Clostridiales bacterium]
LPDGTIGSSVDLRTAASAAVSVINVRIGDGNFGGSTVPTGTLLVSKVVIKDGVLQLADPSKTFNITVQGTIEPLAVVEEAAEVVETSEIPAAETVDETAAAVGEGAADEAVSDPATDGEAVVTDPADEVIVETETVIGGEIAALEPLDAAVTTGTETIVEEGPAAPEVTEPEAPEVVTPEVTEPEAPLTPDVEAPVVPEDLTPVADGDYEVSTPVAQGSTVEFKPGAGTYTITETLPAGSLYKLLSISDGSKANAAAANNLTVKLVKDQPGIAVLVLNTTTDIVTPTPTPPTGGPGPGNSSSGGGGGGNTVIASPTPRVTPTPTPTIIIEETPPPLAAVEFVPLEGFTTDHIRYINGYPDGSFMPDSNITRAETVSIFWRLRSDRQKDRPQDITFPDVNSTEWYNQAVTYMAAKAFVQGYPDGTFGPDSLITRAEIAAMISRFAPIDLSVANGFKDLPNNHWAVDYVRNAVAKGWIMGDPGGTFRPEDNLTRAELVTIVNRMLHRGIAIEDVPSWAVTFPDTTTSHWAYTQVVEAANEHDYEYTNLDRTLEIWRRK